MATHNTEEFIYDHIDQQLQALGLHEARARDLVDPIMDYVELGYGRSTEEELGISVHKGLIDSLGERECNSRTHAVLRNLSNRPHPQSIRPASSSFQSSCCYHFLA